MGTYPVAIKTPAVVRADVHPLVFQLYKSTVVFVAGFLFLIPRFIDPGSTPEERAVPTYVFTYWGVLSAVGWIPAGLATIFSVPIIGVGMSMAIAAGSSAVISFFVFWLVFGNKIKSYSCGETCTYYLAPVWLSFVLIGMVGMVLSPSLKNLPSWLAGGSYIHADKMDEETMPLRNQDQSVHIYDDANFAGDGQKFLQKKRLGNQRANSPPFSGHWWVGVINMLLSGVYCAVQWGSITVGKEYEEKINNCFGNTTKCPPRLKEQFNDIGSWFVSFGIGALLATLGCFVVLALYRLLLRLLGKNSASLQLVPPLEFNVMLVPGLTAGCFWVLGSTFCTLAVVTGGNAIANAQMVAAQLITSGLWGVCYYKEIRKGNVVVWAIFASITLVFMVLLGNEKGV